LVLIFSKKVDTLRRLTRTTTDERGITTKTGGTRRIHEEKLYDGDHFLLKAIIKNEC
jgi:hypothetical protein